MKDYSYLGISKEDLEEFYCANSIEETAKHFQISTYFVKQLLKMYGISAHECGNAIKAGAKKSRTSRVSKEDLEAYYKDHSLSECEKHFKISNPTLVRLLNDYGIPKHSRAESIRLGMLCTHGVENAMDLQETKDAISETFLKKYGVKHYAQTEEYKEKYKNTLLARYGVEHSSQIPGNREKALHTMQKRYGKRYYNNREKSRKTMMYRYGVDVPLKSKEILQKVSDTCEERYGVKYACMREEARIHGNDSKPNRTFANLLEFNNMEFEREFSIGTFQYDFKVGNVLIEINPSYTHNTTFCPFGRDTISPSYHKDKTLVAEENGYRCIHVWDWDDQEKIINLLKPKNKIYARNCTIKEIPSKMSNEFLSAFHLQGYCKAEITIALIYGDAIVSIMTFGKPRYNKNVEYELIRYCSSYNIIGGAKKLFAYFVKTYSPHSVISYCDKSKFKGDVYLNLGFEVLNKNTVPSKHWYNPKTYMHITDNLLRQRGFDQLFGTDYGKGTDNAQLMISHGFVEIYDCGQQSYIWKK